MPFSVKSPLRAATSNRKRPPIRNYLDLLSVQQFASQTGKSGAIRWNAIIINKPRSDQSNSGKYPALPYLNFTSALVAAFAILAAYGPRTRRAATNSSKQKAFCSVSGKFCWQVFLASFSGSSPGKVTENAQSYGLRVKPLAPTSRPKAKRTCVALSLGS